MSERACRECHLISNEFVCPVCKAKSLSDDFSGLAIIFDPEDSKIASVMGVKKGSLRIERVLGCL